MYKKRFLYLIIPIITLILESLPYGAVCIFATSPTERVKETFSYSQLNKLDKDKKSDVYIVAKDFSWTYVRTHECDLGPYLCVKK